MVGFFSGEAASEVKALGKQRDEMEGQMTSLMAELTTTLKLESMDESLMDENGFPRGDLDLPAIRSTKHQLACASCAVH